MEQVKFDYSKAMGYVHEHEVESMKANNFRKNLPGAFVMQIQSAAAQFRCFAYILHRNVFKTFSGK